MLDLRLLGVSVALGCVYIARQQRGRAAGSGIERWVEVWRGRVVEGAEGRGRVEVWRGRVVEGAGE